MSILDRFKRQLPGEPGQASAGDKRQIADLMEELLYVGQKLPRKLKKRVIAQGDAVIQPLIEMALDEELHWADQDSPFVWAPLHAIEILGEMRAEAAIEPLLSLLKMENFDEWLRDALLSAYAKIGPPAIPTLQAYAADRDHDAFARDEAMGALAAIAQKHPRTRAQIISFLTGLLVPPPPGVEDDYTFNAFVICTLLDLKATEAYDDIKRAFDDLRVDDLMVGLDDVHRELGLPPLPRDKEEEEPGMWLRLKCKECGYETNYNCGTVYCDLGTMERHEKGKDLEYSEFIITRRITCVKCGAVDRYELGKTAYLAALAELSRMTMLGEKTDGMGEGTEHFRLIRFALHDGCEMHPQAALEYYRRRIKRQPQRSELHWRYANVLRFLGYRDEARAEYERALELNPSEAEVYYNLATLHDEDGDLDRARFYYERTLATIAASRAPWQIRHLLTAESKKRLEELNAHLRSGTPLQPLELQPVEIVPPPELSPPSRPRPAVRHRRRKTSPALPQPKPAVREHKPPAQHVRIKKVRPGDPCPCGSGKKYKHCHGKRRKKR